MTRRSPEVVDGALGFQHHGSPRDASYVWEALDILAAEVRALREEPIYARLIKANADLRAILARVEALPLQWMDYAVFDTGNVADCARDLEDALKAKP